MFGIICHSAAIIFSISHKFPVHHVCAQVFDRFYLVVVVVVVVVKAAKNSFDDEMTRMIMTVFAVTETESRQFESGSFPHDGERAFQQEFFPHN